VEYLRKGEKMRKVFLFFVILSVILPSAGYLNGSFLSGDGKFAEVDESQDENTVISGLKEALSVGTSKAIELVSQVDGYFGNEMIKILLPEKFEKIGSTLGKIGYQELVDDFVLNMNRAAEAAAPQAAAIFVEAIKTMSFQDARKILAGEDTAATEYFKEETSEDIYDVFKPVVSSTMNEVGVTSSFKTMMDKYASLPFMKKESFDLDEYVTNKALSGLFHMIGEEEKKIRTDPAARGTKLLEKVFKR